jgi:DNA-binding LacI/PurR family transcriptional regulator
LAGYSEIAFIAAPRSRGKHIEHLIAGVDDVKYADMLRVRLTAVRHPFAAIGDAEYHAMLERIERPNAAPRHITLGCELVIRDSTRRIKTE